MALTANLAGENLPLSERSLLALLGEEFAGAKVATVSPVGLRSRNRLLRLELRGAPVARLVVKVVRREVDPFWVHHLRREHWLLELLARGWPVGAPRTYGAVFGAGWGALLLEDVGPRSLAAALAVGPHPALSPGERVDDVGDAGGGGESENLSPQGGGAGVREASVRPSLERVVELHAVLRRQAAVFRRVCHSVDLDRITARSLLARLDVAHTRLASPGEHGRLRGLSAATRQAYSEVVAAPLLGGRRQMIHNSLSPLNVVLGTAPRFVDWETMALAAPEFDLAELLRYPDIGLDWAVTERLVASVYGDDIDPRRLRLAALARAIDYAGANAQQRRRGLAQGDTAHAALAGRRLGWYLGELAGLAAEFGLGRAAEEIAGEVVAACDD